MHISHVTQKPYNSTVQRCLQDETPDLQQQGPAPNIEIERNATQRLCYPLRKPNHNALGTTPQQTVKQRVSPAGKGSSTAARPVKRGGVLMQTSSIGCHQVIQTGCSACSAPQTVPKRRGVIDTAGLLKSDSIC